MRIRIHFFLLALLLPICFIGQTTITRQITQSSDDAEESLVDGSINLTDTSIEMTTGVTSQRVGFRFTNITIPQGSRILSASIQFSADAINTGNSAIVIEGHAVDNSSTFQSVNNDLSNRATTNALSVWKNIPDWNIIGERALPQRSVSLLNIVQEQVDRPGWNSGNAISFIMIGSGIRTTSSFDSGGTTPELKIIYNTGITYTSIGDGDWDDNSIWSTDLGATPCNCSPPIDKIEDGTTVLIRNDILMPENLLIEEGGALNLTDASLEMEQNFDVKPGGFFSATNSFIFTDNGNIKNEGSFLNLNSCLSLDNGTFENSSGLDNDGNEGVIGSGFVNVLNGDIKNSGFWDVNITWCALNGNSDLPSGDENCAETVAGCDALNDEANLVITKTAPATINNGQQLTYTITITNNGPDDATNVIVSDLVPAEVTSPEFSVDGGTTYMPWPGNLAYPTLSNGGTETLLIRGTVNISSTATLTNTAIVFSDSRDEDYTNNIDTAVTTFSGGPTTVITNRRITYRVKKD